MIIYAFLLFIGCYKLVRGDTQASAQLPVYQCGSKSVNYIEINDFLLLDNVDPLAKYFSLASTSLSFV